MQIAIEKGRERGKQKATSHGGPDVDAEVTTGPPLRRGEACVDVLELLHDPSTLLVVGGSFGRDGDAPGRARQELDAEVRFKRLNEFADRRLRHSERIRRLREVAGLDDSRKRPDCEQLVHAVDCPWMWTACPVMNGREVTKLAARTLSLGAKTNIGLGARAMR